MVHTHKICGGLTTVGQGEQYRPNSDPFLYFFVLLIVKFCYFSEEDTLYRIEIVS